MKNLFGKYWSKKANDENGAKKRKPGFTLVEILIVVAVIGILFVTLVPRIDFAGDKARETGIKTDFRAFELAAEQTLREHAGLAFVEDGKEIEDLVEEMNMFLDPAVQFEVSGTDTFGTCNKEDQWNQNYTVYVTAKHGTNDAAITFVSNGKDSSNSVSAVSAETSNDDYILTVTYKDGIINCWTDGFSTNIEAQDEELPTLA
ncbi:MAG: type II secretion system protein [Clostridia bacterium]|nr:type II secretion system protein [Clostridia bacterium]